MENNREQYVDIARSLAGRICRDAIWEKNACNWIGASTEDHFGMPKGFARALPTSFYDGTAGVAFFLSNVLKITPNGLLQKTVEGAVQQIIDQELSTKPNHSGGKLGFHTGYPGEAFVIFQIAEQLKKPEYREAAEALTQKIFDLPEEESGLDIIDGAAGAIPCLLSIYKQYPHKKILEYTRYLGEFLEKKSISDGATMSWKTMDNSAPLTGFAHGAAGIATAFLELYARFKEVHYLEIARKAFAYENRHFNKAQQNWPDFRAMPQNGQQVIDEETDNRHCGLAWCHGAPGIALSRIRAYQLTSDDVFLQDLEIAVATTLNSLKPSGAQSFSLCHGLFGNAESVLYASEILPGKGLKDQLVGIIDKQIQQTFLKGEVPLNGLHNYSETPDFMLGTSGMGYFLLRMYDSRAFPSVLILIP